MKIAIWGIDGWGGFVLMSFEPLNWKKCGENFIFFSKYWQFFLEMRIFCLNWLFIVKKFLIFRQKTKFSHDFSIISNSIELTGYTFTKTASVVSHISFSLKWNSGIFFEKFRLNLWTQAEWKPHLISNELYKSKNV